jgi:kumamolisin
VPADTRIEATVVLRRAGGDPDPDAGPISREEFAERYGASSADLELVTSTLRGLGIDVLETDRAARRVRVAGPTDRLSAAFGATLHQVESRQPDGGSVAHRHRTGSLSVPSALDGVVVAVLGLDDRPQAQAHFRVAASAARTGYTPLELASIYRFPADTDGSGQTIAIIELGGGYQQSDLDAYFGELGVTGPAVRSVGVDGAANGGGKDPQGADGEVLLDIEVIGALAPAADVAVYFAPNTDAGFLDAITTATQADPTPTTISISWGDSEDAWTAQARSAMDQALLDAATLGVTVTVACGDNGSSDGATDGASHVDFPASSPHALACGGTSLRADPAAGSVQAETVWNDGGSGGATGGGVSTAFARPSWQAGAGVPSAPAPGGRGVPDVAADADPQTGYRVRVDGQDLIIGGTSAVAPLWAALIARLAQARGAKLGLVQPALYGTASTASVPAGFRDITEGSNGAYSAGPGWDPCTGLGVPDGTALLAALGGSS